MVRGRPKTSTTARLSARLLWSTSDAAAVVDGAPGHTRDGLVLGERAGDGEPEIHVAGDVVGELLAKRAERFVHRAQRGGVERSEAGALDSAEARSFSTKSASSIASTPM